MLTVTMLQSPRICLDGREIHFPFKRVDALFYYMIVNRHATRQELISLLWESNDEATGLKNLRNALYTLRKELGGDFLISPKKSGIEINSQWEFSSDYDQFMRDGNPAVFSGDFLQGFSLKNAFSYEEWLFRTREKLRTQYLGILSHRAKDALLDGQVEKAVSLLQTYLLEDPFDEEIACRLMQAFRTQRQYQKASEVYTTLKDKIDQDLAIDPLEDTTALYYDILNEWNCGTAAPTTKRTSPRDEIDPASFSETQRHLAQLVCLFPDGAPNAALLHLMECDEGTLAQTLSQLQSLGVLEEDHSTSPSRCVFSVAGMRDTLYDEMNSFQVRPLHQKAAEFLSQHANLQSAKDHYLIAQQYQLAEDTLSSISHRISGLEIEVSAACHPFSCHGQRDIYPPAAGILSQQIQSLFSALSSLSLSTHEQATITALQERLTLMRGAIALFSGDAAIATTLLGELTGGELDARNLALHIQACYLLANSAQMTQQADLLDRYLTTGLRLLARQPDPLMQARFQRLRGNFFCLRGDYEKSTYYLAESMESLQHLSASLPCAHPLAEAYFDFGRIQRQQNNFAKAVSYFKRAISLLEREDIVGAVRLYTSYARTAFALEDHAKARELFALAHRSAKKTGELWGASTASAFCAYYSTMDQEYQKATEFLSDAQSYDKAIAAPLEHAILCFVSLLIRQQLDQMGKPSVTLENLLPYSAESYARQGTRALSGVPDVYEVALLSKQLRNGMSSKTEYSAKELYSKHKHFMAE